MNCAHEKRRASRASAPRSRVDFHPKAVFTTCVVKASGARRRRALSEAPCAGTRCVANLQSPAAKGISDLLETFVIVFSSSPPFLLIIPLFSSPSLPKKHTSPPRRSRRRSSASRSAAGEFSYERDRERFFFLFFFPSSSLPFFFFSCSPLSPFPPALSRPSPPSPSP